MVLPARAADVPCREVSGTCTSRPKRDWMWLRHLLERGSCLGACLQEGDGSMGRCKKGQGVGAWGVRQGREWTCWEAPFQQADVTGTGHGRITQVKN
jgi:hypothetical protein